MWVCFSVQFVFLINNLFKSEIAKTKLLPGQGIINLFIRYLINLNKQKHLFGP